MISKAGCKEIRRKRRAAQLSQRALGRMTGISDVWVSKIERGTTPHPTTLIVLLAALDGIKLNNRLHCEAELGTLEMDQ